MLVQLVQLLLWISQKPDVWDSTPRTWAEQTWAVLYKTPHTSPTLLVNEFHFLIPPVAGLAQQLGAQQSAAPHILRHGG